MSAHHIAEVESVSLTLRGSESIPDRLDHEAKPAFRDAENLKNSIDMMDQILTLNDSWSERRIVPNKTAATPHSSKTQPPPPRNHEQTSMLDSLLEDLATIRTQSYPQPAPVIRRVKFQTPNGHVVTPASPVVNGKSNTFEVTISKDPYYEDFGFSLSDGAFERGVYVNRIRPSGPAETIGLKTCDQILKVSYRPVSRLPEASDSGLMVKVLH